MEILHNGTCTMACGVLQDIRIAKEAGYDGMEMIGPKVDAFLASGLSLDILTRHLDGFPVRALPYIGDIDRTEPERFQALMDECNLRFGQAVALGAEQVELTNGPIGPGVGVDDGYSGPQGSRDEIIETTAKNLKIIADMAGEKGLKLYLELLGWAELSTIEDAVDLLDATDRVNVGVVVDFWHFWVNGNTAADIGKLKAEQIFAVHFCDSLPPPTDGSPITHELREVWTGAGHIPLQDWVDAILATGYRGWFSGELFASAFHQHDPLLVASALRNTIQLTLDAALPPAQRPWPKTPRLGGTS